MCRVTIREAKMPGLSVLFLGLIMVSVAGHHKQGACPRKWMAFDAENGQTRCYLFGDEVVKGSDYANTCAMKGGKTLTVDSPRVVKFFRTVEPDGEELGDYWIGINMTKGKWINNKGVEISWTNWKEPPSVNSETCAIAKRRYKYKWFPEECSLRNDFFCEQAGTVVCDTSWQGPFSGFEYRYYTSANTIEGAQSVCLNDGGDLVSIHSDAEWALVQTLVCDGATEVWIGMLLEQAWNKSSAKWLDKSEVDFTPSNFTLDSPEPGIHMSRSDQDSPWEWNNLDETSWLRYICKRDPSLTTSIAEVSPSNTTTAEVPLPTTTTAEVPSSTTTTAEVPSSTTTTAEVPSSTTTTLSPPTTDINMSVTTANATSTTTTPKVYVFRKDVQIGYTRSPSPCQAEEWAYSNQTGNCYLFFIEQVTQDEAIDVCKERNADLLSVENQDEQKFLDAVLSFDFYDHWTAGRKNEMGYFTYGGKEITYDNWLADDLVTKPEEGEDVCIALVKNMHHKGVFLMRWKWDTRPCSEKKSFVCQQIARRCPPPPIVDFVEPHPPKPFIELTIKYECKPGYKMPNYPQRYLEWQQKKPTINVTKEETDAWEASKPNITTMPSMKYECLYPGNWSDGSLAPCEPKSCKEPPEVEYAERNSSDRIFPTWIEYKCEHGYHFEQDNTSTQIAWCGPDEEWIDVPPGCSPVECCEFPRVGNATVNSPRKQYMDTVVWTCTHGFMFPDRTVSQWVRCRENYVNWQIGRWNISKLDDCVPIECPEPANPTNTTRNSNATAFQSIISYRCVSSEFEFPNGDEEMLTECSIQARWKPTVPPCRKKPPKLKMKGKKYQPPAKESPRAKTVGTLAVIIMSVLLLLTILIDLGTCYRGFRYLRHNVRTFTRYHGFE